MSLMDIRINMDENGRKAFIIGDKEEELGRMEYGVKDNLMTVYHTEVSPKAEGKGLAKELLNHMVSYARENKLKVKPLCEFVHLQFKRKKDEFKDLWDSEDES